MAVTSAKNVNGQTHRFFIFKKEVRERYLEDSNILLEENKLDCDDFSFEIKTTPYIFLITDEWMIHYIQGIEFPTKSCWFHQ